MFMLDPGKKIPKEIAKKFKKIKILFLAIFLAKMGWDWPRKREKILVPNYIHTRPWHENSEKNRKKIQKVKNLFPALFLAKTGRDGPRKREKNFSPKFCSYTTGEENSKKKKSKKILKIKKIKKVNTGIISIQNGLREAEKEWKKF